MSTLHRLVGAFEEALGELGTSCPPEEIERLAFLVHRCMGGAARQFHTIDHVFGFLDDADSYTVLAALFHDLVYYQVDKGFPPGVAEALEAFIEQEISGGWKVRQRIQIKDKATVAEFDRITAVFGLRNGQAIATNAGMNEFLSAVLMWLNLRPLLAEPVILRIAAYIEATIAFRPKDPDGSSSYDKLEKRLVGAGIPAGQAREITQAAVVFANVDVADFKLADTGRFLNNTWKLLPEINPSLRVQGYYSVIEYRKAIQGMEGFFGFLKPDLIYHEHKGVPGEAEIASMIEMASRNLGYAREYLQAKLLAVGVLEAAVLCSGGDTPLSYVMGDIPVEGIESQRLDDILPEVGSSVSEQGTVYQLLESGRLSESSFDLKNSPLALFLYRQLTAEEFLERMSATRKLFAGEITGEDYLSGWKSGVRKPLLESLAQMVPTRREKLRALA